MAELTITGGCACGAVRYAASEAPGFSFHCQCRDCQRATGGGHASAMVFSADAVDVAGEICFYDRQSERGNSVSQGFCPTCGSPLMNRNSGFPGSLYIHAASLDDPSLFQPTTVVCGASAQPWDHVDPELK